MDSIADRYGQIWIDMEKNGQRQIPCLQEYAACPLDGVEDSRATVRGQGPEADRGAVLEDGR